MCPPVHIGMTDDNFVFRESYDSFEEAFPDIDDIDVRVEEHDLVETKRTLHFSMGDIPGKVECTNRQCTGRGVRIDDLVSRMQRDDETEAEFEESCRGVEKIGDGERSCVHGFTVEISIDYDDS